jgi:hypothetical protein
MLFLSILLVFILSGGFVRTIDWLDRRYPSAERRASEERFRVMEELEAKYRQPAGTPQ